MSSTAIPAKPKFEVKLGAATREAYGQALGELGKKNPNVVVLDPVPSELLPIKATTTAAIAKDTSVPQEARALIQFLRSPTAIAVFKAKGFDPN